MVKATGTPRETYEELGLAGEQNLRGQEVELIDGIYLTQGYWQI